MPIDQMRVSDVELIELAARLRRMPWSSRDCDQAAALLEQLCLTDQVNSLVHQVASICASSYEDEPEAWEPEARAVIRAIAAWFDKIAASDGDYTHRAAAFLRQEAEPQIMNRAEQVLASHKRAMQCFRAFRAMRDQSRAGTFVKALAESWFLADGASKGRLSAAFPELIQEWSASADIEDNIHDGR